MPPAIVPGNACSEVMSPVNTSGGKMPAVVSTFEQIDGQEYVNSRRKRFMIRDYIFKTPDQAKFYKEALDTVLNLVCDFQVHVGPNCGSAFQHKWQEMGIKLNEIIDNLDEFEMQFSRFSWERRGFRHHLAENTKETAKTC